MEVLFLKLSTYAKTLGICYKTAWNHFKSGKIPGAYQLKTGTIIVSEKEQKPLTEKIVVYARVSSNENKNNLDTQAERICSYCYAKGYIVSKIVKETASGLNDSRPKLMLLLKDKSITKIVVEHKDRLTRFGFNYIKVLLNSCNREIEVINESDSKNEDILQDFISIITSFCARIYGTRRSKRKTEKIIKELEDDQKINYKS
jgi:putative resolvase